MVSCIVVDPLVPSGSSRLAGAAMSAGLPTDVGLGLKAAHFEEILSRPPQVGFFEVHAENYMVDGGPLHHYLSRIRECYPLSMHGVALSIGAESAPDRQHLRALRVLLDRYQPASFSEHLAWSTHGDVFLNDLLPLAYNRRTLDRVCDHIDLIQAFLGRRLLLENPATYLEFEASSMDEAGFMTQVVRRTGCGLLLDVNNVHVSCTNHRRDAHDYLRALPLDQVGEIHLAGFAEQVDGLGAPLLIDHHGASVSAEVWNLYAHALSLTGPVVTLIERDNNVPAYDVLVAEAVQARQRLQSAFAQTACGTPT